MVELVDAMLKSTPLHVALIAIVLLAIGREPIMRKVHGLLHNRAEMPVAKVNGHGIVSLIETVLAPLPRNWANWVDERIEHKRKNMLQELDLHMALTKDKLSVLEPINVKLSDVQARLSRIEGKLEVIEMRRAPRG